MRDGLVLAYRTCNGCGARADVKADAAAAGRAVQVKRFNLVEQGLYLVPVS